MGRELDFEVEIQRKTRRPNWTGKKQVEEEDMKLGLRREDVFIQRSEFLSAIRLALGRGESGHPHML